MGKKLILACAALVALAAFALPATASAKPRLCETVGANCETLATGKKIHAHQVGASKLTAKDEKGNTITLVECSAATATGTLTKNNAEAVEGTIESASFTGTAASGKCTSALGGPTLVTTSPVAPEAWNGLPWCLSASGTEDKFTVRGGACNETTRAITFVLHTTNIGVCRYARTSGVEGTFTTHTSSTEDAVLTVAGAEVAKDGSGVLCPNIGFLDTTFTLTTDDSPTFTTLYLENV
jgi:hypothetical protein